jgi:hypothetical protein
MKEEDMALPEIDLVQLRISTVDYAVQEKRWYQRTKKDLPIVSMIDTLL